MKFIFYFPSRCCFRDSKPQIPSSIWTLIKMTFTHYLFTSPHLQMTKTMKTMIWNPFSLTSCVCATVVQSHLGVRSVAEGVWILPRGRQVEGEPRTLHWSHCSVLDTDCWHLMVVAGDIQVQPQVPPADKAPWAWPEDMPFVDLCNSLVLNLIKRIWIGLFTWLWTTMYCVCCSFTYLWITIYIYCPVWRETWWFVKPRKFMSPENVMNCLG